MSQSTTPITELDEMHMLTEMPKARVDDTIRKVYVEPTSACNLSCPGCMRTGRDNQGSLMEWTVFEALLDGFARFPALETVSFAGVGEPLLHPEFPKMVAAAHELGLRTEMTTNAMLLTRELANKLNLAGLDQMAVSLDGTTQETIDRTRTGANLATIVDNLSALKRFDPSPLRYVPWLRLGIAFVARKSNIHELPSLSAIASRIGASFVLVSNLLEVSRRREFTPVRIGPRQVPSRAA